MSVANEKTLIFMFLQFIKFHVKKLKNNNNGKKTDNKQLTYMYIAKRKGRELRFEK